MANTNTPGTARCRATVNPTTSSVIWQDVTVLLGEWDLPLSVAAAREILDLSAEWRVPGPNGPARSIQLHGVAWSSVWQAAL